MAKIRQFEALTKIFCAYVYNKNMRQFGVAHEI